MSWHLQERGIDHVVLERARVGERWRSERWDSLMFQFTSDRLSLPGLPYDGLDPDGFAHHTEVLGRIEQYRRLIDAPVREQTGVERLAPHLDGWELTTSSGPIRARAVVSATGPFQRPPGPSDGPRPGPRRLPTARDRLPQPRPAAGRRRAGRGGGRIAASRCAEELLESGRAVHLSVSGHRRMPRRYRGHDLFWWLERWGFLDRTRDEWPDGRMPPSLVPSPGAAWAADTTSTSGGSGRTAPSSSVIWWASTDSTSRTRRTPSR